MNENNYKPCHAEMMIKVCGMCDSKNIQDVASLYPMMMGFIFYKKSKRYFGEQNPDILKELPKYINKVAVFVNETVENMKTICDRYDIDIIQLHGDESVEVCSEMKGLGYTILKAVGIQSVDDMASLNKYVGRIDMFVFDKKSKQFGGTGKKFNHKLLDYYNLPIPYMLSGGIAPTDVPIIISNLRKGMVGIDVNSCFENKEGLKDLKLLTNFIVELRKYNEYEPDRIPFFKKTK